MMDMHEKREKLQEYLREPGCTPIMCAYDVLSAKLIENAGFPIVYTGSFITGASQFGMADVGLVSVALPIEPHQHCYFIIYPLIIKYIIFF